MCKPFETKWLFPLSIRNNSKPHKRLSHAHLQAVRITYMSSRSAWFTALHTVDHFFVPGSRTFVEKDLPEGGDLNFTWLGKVSSLHFFGLVEYTRHFPTPTRKQPYDRLARHWRTSMNRFPNSVYQKLEHLVLGRGIWSSIRLKGRTLKQLFGPAMREYEQANFQKFKSPEVGEVCSSFKLISALFAFPVIWRKHSLWFWVFVNRSKHWFHCAVVPEWCFSCVAREQTLQLSAYHWPTPSARVLADLLSKKTWMTVESSLSAFRLDSAPVNYYESLKAVSFAH